MINPAFLNRTVTLQRPTVTKDASGGALRAWADVAGTAGTAAGVQPLTTADIALYAGRQINVSHAVYTEIDLGYRRGDRLKVDDGRTFSIRGVLDAAGQNRVYKLVCREILS